MTLDILRQPERIAIGKLRTDGGTQPRAGLDQSVVQDYSEQFAENSWPFPPVVAFYDGESYWLADGFHRTAAALLYMQRKGYVSIPVLVDVRQGERRDAILYSVGANTKHGLRRTNEDKRRAVSRLLEDAEWGQWSNREIARRCDVDEKIVRSLRGELSAAEPQIGDTTRTATRDGVTYTIDTANIGKATPAPVAASHTASQIATADGGPQTAARNEKLVIDWTDEDWEAYAAAKTPPAQQTTADDRPQTAADEGATTGRRGLAAEMDAFQWLRFYQDNKGRTWKDLEDTQVYHANSPCFQAFVRAYPGLVDHRAVLRRALLDLRATQAPEKAPPPQQTTADDRPQTAADEAATSDEQERGRLGSLSATLGHVVRLLGFGNDAQTAEDYGFGIEFQRLVVEAGGLREEVRKLTPRDRI